MKEDNLRYEIEELDKKLAILSERVSIWLDTTTEYRKNLCAKVDSINSHLFDLPCKERRGLYEGVSNQLKVLWGLVTAIVLIIIAEWMGIKH